MFGLGYQELLLILVIVLVLFGGGKLPDLAKSLGKSMKEFKKGIAAEPEEDGRSSTPPTFRHGHRDGPADLQRLPVSDGCGLGTLPALRDDRGARFDANSAEVVPGWLC